SFKTDSRSLWPVVLPRVVILTPKNHVRKRPALRTVKMNFYASVKITADVVSYNWYGINLFHGPLNVHIYD
ncbi:hypothetical protein, partial [Xenorhabdus bovienii]|uniref:hypothetical protein n=1 Tax=Xenorhabdus bovienii TaxID=40576 RepID=UPI00237CA071